LNHGRLLKEWLSKTIWYGISLALWMSWANFISIRYLSRLNSRSDSKTAKTRKRALSVAALIASMLADALTLSTVNVAIISGLLRFARTRLMSVPGKFLSRDAVLRMTLLPGYVVAVMCHLSILT